MTTRRPNPDLTSTSSRARAARRRDRAARPGLEGMEGRLLLSAATYTVDAVGESGYSDSATSGDLRYCVDEADGNPGSTIEFSSGIDSSIDMTSVLKITANMSIIAPAGTAITLDGGGTSQIFRVQAGVTATISGLTINAGDDSSRENGAIVNGGNLTVTNATFSNSVGDALDNYGNLTLLGDTFTNNAAIDSALVNVAGTATLTNTSFSGNTSMYGSGAILNETQLAMTGGSITGNSAGYTGSTDIDQPYFAGGLVNFGTASLTGVAITNNTGGNDGGGVFNYRTLTITGGSITGNSTGGEPWGGATIGGGLYNDGNATLTGVNVSDNFADSEGEGIYNDGTLALDLDTIASNRLPSGYPFAADEGGGLFNDGTATVGQTTFSGNVAAIAGGAIFNDAGATLTSAGDAYLRNGSGYGGGPYNAGTATLADDTLFQNTAADAGGGVDNIAGAMLTLTNDTIGFNSAPDSNPSGGGVNNLGTAQVDNTILTNDSGGDLTDQAGGVIAGGYDEIGDGRVPAGLTSVLLGPADLELLGYYEGSPIETMPLAFGAPAIDAGCNALAVGANGTPLLADAEGNARIANGTVDLGAVEADLPVISIEAGGTQASLVNGVYPSDPIALVLLDGDPDPGVTVYFKAPTGAGPGGTFRGGATSISVKTNAAGIADPGTFTAGGVAGAFQVSASLLNGTAPAASAPILVVSYAMDNVLPVAITSVSGSGVRNDNASLTATLMNQATPLAGQVVAFFLGGLAVGTATTNVFGVATFGGPALWGQIAGGYNGTVTASFAGTATYAASSGSGAANLHGYLFATQIGVSSGSSQLAYLGTAVGSPFKAIVTDAYGNPVPGASVTFTAPAGSGTFAGGSTSVSVVSGANGIATAPTFAASMNVGNYSIAASLYNPASGTTQGTAFPLGRGPQRVPVPDRQ